MNFENILEILNKAVGDKLARNLNNPETIILKGTWQGLSYEQMAAPASKYTLNYLMRDVGRDLWRLLSEIYEEKINKSNFRFVMQQKYDIDPEPFVNTNFVSKKSLPLEKSIIDWGDAPNTSIFYGRKKELEILRICISENNYQLLAITGLKEIGKSFLAAEFVENNQDNFQAIIWTDCRKDNFNFDNFLQYLTKKLSVIHNPINKDITKKQVVISYLQTHKCLLVLDNLAEKEKNNNEEISKLIQFIEEIVLLRTKSYLLLTTIDIPTTIKHFFSTNTSTNYLGYILTLSKYTKQEIKEIVDSENIIYKEESDELDCLYYTSYQGFPKDFANKMRIINTFCQNNLSLYKHTYTFSSDVRKTIEIIDNLSVLETYIVLYLCGEKKPISAPFNQLTKEIYSLIQEEPNLQKEKQEIKSREDLWVQIDSLHNKTIIKLNEQGEFQLETLFKTQHKKIRDLLKTKLKT